MAQAIRRGLMAGATGTTALHTATYLDLALRGRPPSGTFERTVRAFADACTVRIPGMRCRRAQRTTAMAALGGIGTGLAVGVAASLTRAAGVRLPTALGALATGAAAMAADSACPVTQGFTDLREWSPADWVSHTVPYLAYGVTTSAVLREMDRPRPAPARIRPSKRPGGLLLRSAALGFAAGARSTMGVAGVLLASRRLSGRPASRLGRGRYTAGALAVGAELVADKLPVTPSRLQAPSLALRIASGSGGAAALARQANTQVAVPAAVGAVCAAAGSLAGAAWREAAATRMPSWCAAVVEDAAALLLTSVAASAGEHGEAARERVLDGASRA